MAKLTVTHLLGQSLPDGSPYFADLVDATHTSSFAEIDTLLETLQEHKDEWVQLGINERLAILDEINADLVNIMNRWVSAEIEAKGIPPQSVGEAEEWTLLATVFRAIRRLRQSLNEIESYGRPKINGPVETKPNGQVVAHVFPQTIFDRLLFLGVRGEAWMEPGATVEELTMSQASAYQDKELKGKVSLVLGAGNTTMLVAIDLLHKLFVELQVVAVKPNPVNAYMGPLMNFAFRALIKRGFLGIVYGGVEEGSYLCNHPAVEELHMTGSDKTYEAIVFGVGPEGKERKTARSPIITKRFTGELGNVSPVIIVPGPWNLRDIKEQAKQIATWHVVNAGCGCLTPRVIIQHKSWTQRETLLEEIGQILDNFPTRMAYYPGASDRHAEFTAIHPEAIQYGSPESGHLPWTIIPDVDSKNADDICFRHEAFCSLCAETAIDAPTVVDFIASAVDFANNTMWGTLNATLIIHPKSLKDPAVAEAVDRAIDQLRYGTVSLNMLAFFSAFFMVNPWGAFPGHDLFNIQSGTGKTFNFLMFERPEKSVVRAPFKRFDPLTVKSKNATEFCRKLAVYEANPAWSKLPGLIWSALRS
jgi:acyl-CoA reductase-like NAD-dependent aldehyde dehydrogenase